MRVLPAHPLTLPLSCTSEILGSPGSLQRPVERLPSAAAWSRARPAMREMKTAPGPAARQGEVGEWGSITPAGRRGGGGQRYGEGGDGMSRV